MKRALALLAAVAVLTVLVGCSTTHVSQYSSPLEVKLQTDKTPVVAVSNEIKGEATVHRLFFFIWGASTFADGVNYGGQGSISLFGEGTIGIAKDAAAYDACVKNGADVIVAPRYIVENDNYFVYERTNAKVKGFKGKFNGLK